MTRVGRGGAKRTAACVLLATLQVRACFGSGLEDGVSVRQIVGLVLVVIGIVALVWGGVFWTDRDTVVDAGPLEIATENREGVALPPVVGVLSLVAGAVLLLIPKRTGV